MATAGARNRGKGGPGSLTWVALGGAALVILGLTFALGMLVGRQWARQTQPAVAAEPARRAASPPRRSGLSDVGAGRAAQPQEKLTFYQTLTAPLGGGPMSGRAEVAPKPQPAAKPRGNPDPAPERAQERVAARGDEPALPPRAVASVEGQDRPRLTPVAPKAGEERHEASPEWTVQVGVFKSPQQADRVRSTLADGGFQSQVTPMTAAAGQIRYRVRVGAFKTKDEALRTAERIRSDRSLSTFVTAK